MTTYAVHHGDIFDVATDCLVCSANVFLTLSGGVGGELLLRFGPIVQEPLTTYLAARGQRFTHHGDVVVTRPSNAPYKRVLHAVAVDGMYDSSSAVVAGVVRGSLAAAAKAGCRSIAFPALATGYGHLSLDAFLVGYVAGLKHTPREIDTVTLALRDAEHAASAKAAIDQARTPRTPNSPTPGPRP